MAHAVQSIIPARLTKFVEMQGIASSKRVFKFGSIEINGRKIQVSSGDSLESFAEKINRHKHFTKVEATVISNETHTKLLLKSKGKELSFTDSNGIFKDHHKSGKLGVYKGSLIQVVRDSTYLKPTDVILNYSTETKKQPIISASTLSEFNKFELSRFDTNTPANIGPKLVLAPKVRVDVPHMPLAIIEATEVPLLVSAPKVTMALPMPDISSLPEAVGEVDMIPHLEIPDLSAEPEISDVTDTIPFNEPKSNISYHPRVDRSALVDCGEDHPLSPIFASKSHKPRVTRPIVPTFNEERLLQQHNERVRLKEIEDRSEHIVKAAINDALEANHFPKDFPLKQNLTKQLIRAILSKYSADIEPLHVHTMSLTNEISKRITKAHSTMQAGFDAIASGNFKLRLSITQNDIDGIESWISKIRLPS